jgi:taurine dioxygenase
MALQIRPVTGTIGADVLDVDLARPLDPTTVETLHAALAEHSVLFFADQHLTTEQHLEFARQLGRTNPAHPAPRTGLTELPEIYVPVTYPPVSDGAAAPRWHVDHAYMAEPSSIAILRAVDVPGLGGDTQWASTAAAYERLSPTFQQFLEGLTIVHNAPADWTRHVNEYGPGRWNDQPVHEFGPVEHPLVTVHPVTGRRQLLLNPNTTPTAIKQLSADESTVLLDFLLRHVTRPEFVVRYRWAPGAVVAWDNRATLHAPVGDTPAGTTRLLHRVSLQGQRPAGVTR